MSLLGRVFRVLSFLAVSLAFSVNAWAIFELGVSPRDGGTHIRFDLSSPEGAGLLRNEEVDVEVTSDQATAYRITQTLYQPLTSEKGDILPQEAFIMYSPSSPLGTLRIEQERPITLGQNVIYTSNGAGESDRFTIVYNVRVPENQPGGIYTTRLTYTLEAVDAGSALSQRVVNLDVRVELRSTFKMEIRRSNGGRGLDLGRIDEKHSGAEDVLVFRVDANLGTSYRITQQLAEPLVSPEGNLIPADAFEFQGAGRSSGDLDPTPHAVPEAPAPLYTNQEGTSDVFEVRYAVKPPASQRAGVYTGTLLFRVESNSSLAPAEAFSVPVKLEIEPVLYLDVQTQEGQGIAFGRFKGEEAREREIKIQVRTNLGAPYQVSHILGRKITAEGGQPLPEDSFTFFGEQTETGRMAAESATAVKEGENVVFTSDSKGTPENLTLHYRLSIPKNALAGSYNSDIKYSITTL